MPLPTLGSVFAAGLLAATAGSECTLGPWRGPELWTTTSTYAWRSPVRGRKVKARFSAPRGAGAGPGRLAVRYRLPGWQAVRVVRVGIVDEAGRFFHTRTRIIPPDQWVSARFDPDSIAAFMDNPAFPAATAPGLVSARIEIEGVPGPRAGFLLQSSGCEPAKGADYRTPNPAPRNLPPHQSGPYWAKKREEAKPRLPAFLENYRQGLVLQPGFADPVPYRTRLPEAVKASPSRSYRWHALDHVRMLLFAFDGSGEPELLDRARSAYEDWWRSFYLSPSRDKYVWYDHGVAERALVMLDLAAKEQARGAELRSLIDPLYKHLQLLAEPAFYLRHQPFFPHNHGLFQDITLVELARTLRRPSLIQLGVRRASAQLQHLVTPQGVLTENSTGYHKGILALCERTAETVRVEAPSLAEVCRRMEVFSRAMTYPDGTLPAWGDTTWTPNETRPSGPFPRPGDDVLDFAESGYLIRKGQHQGSAYQLFFGAPNRSITHKHQDHLSFTLWFDGLELLVDGGYYVGDQPRPREYARSVEAHNAVFLAGETYDIAPGRARLELRRGDVFAGEHRAYSKWEVTRSLRLEETWTHVRVEIDDAVGPKPAPLPPRPRKAGAREARAGFAVAARARAQEARALKTRAYVRFHLGDRVLVKASRPGVFELWPESASRPARLRTTGTEACRVIDGEAYPSFDRGITIPVIECRLGPDLRASTSLILPTRGSVLWLNVGTVGTMLVIGLTALGFAATQHRSRSTTPRA